MGQHSLVDIPHKSIRNPREKGKHRAPYSPTPPSLFRTNLKAVNDASLLRRPHCYTVTCSHTFCLHLLSLLAKLLNYFEREQILTDVNVLSESSYPRQHIQWMPVNVESDISKKHAGLSCGPGIWKGGKQVPQAQGGSSCHCGPRAGFPQRGEREKRQNTHTGQSISTSRLQVQSLGSLKKVRFILV